MRLFNGFKPEEGRLAQYAAVYVLKWRQEFGEPEMLFCEADYEDDSIYDGLVTALEGLMDSAECHFLKQKDPQEYDEYDEMMAPKWEAARDALALAGVTE